MPELLPNVSEARTAALAEVRKGRHAVVVGLGGSGRSVLMRDLAGETGAVPADLLALSEPDASLAALIEVGSGIADERVRAEVLGTAADRVAAAELASRTLQRAGRFLVCRAPSSWGDVLGRGGDGEESARHRRGADLLQGLLAGGVPILVVADWNVEARSLGISDALRIELRDHAVPFSSLQQRDWQSYTSAAKRIASAVPPGVAASPINWRVAVGALALGADLDSIVIGGHPASIDRLAPIIANRIAPMPDLRDAVVRFLSVRRPIPIADLARVVRPPADHEALFRCAIGYGENHLKVAPFVREMLLERMLESGASIAAPHADLASYYASQDGRPDPTGLDRPHARAWIEKVHHFAHSGQDAARAWNEQRLLAPEMYWDRGRSLSIERGDYAGAARVYQSCVERYPRDDYAWHYLAWNLEQTQGARGEIERAYHKAVELAPDNPWWNSRLVTWKIRDACPRSALREWESAVERVDPDGSRVADGPWLATHFHFWVSSQFYDAGWAARARAVLESVPRSSRGGRVQRLWESVETATRTESSEATEWTDFLDALEARTGLSAAYADVVRTSWRKLRAAVGRDLPLPAAEPSTSGEAFQFTWSLRAMYLEVSVASTGRIEWFGRDYTKNEHGGSSAPESGVSSKLIEWLRRLLDA